MSTSSDPEDDVQVERIDADAVCEACGTVNPEDTLLCKTCGNNLRDQRSRRLGGAYDLEGMQAERKPLFGLKIALAVMGILLFVAVAVNLGSIEEFMLRAETAKTTSGERFWLEPKSARFAAMAKKMHEHQVTDADVQAAIANPVKADAVDGHYVIMPQNAGPRVLPYGEAIVETDGEVIYFLVLLDEPNIEIRGEARKEGESRIACRNDAGFRLDLTPYEASGFAAKMETGAYACYAMSTLNADNFGATAYRLP